MRYNKDNRLGEAIVTFHSLRRPAGRSRSRSRWVANEGSQTHPDSVCLTALSSLWTHVSLSLPLDYFHTIILTIQHPRLPLKLYSSPIVPPVHTCSTPVFSIVHRSSWIRRWPPWDFMHCLLTQKHRARSSRSTRSSITL